VTTAEMQRRLATEDIQRPITRVIVQERPVAGEFVFHVRKFAA
jgi:hypothetical protein